MERRILVVDDNPMFRELEAIFLAGSGEVITAESGSIGLELARRHRPHVMIVGLDMPDLAGDAVCREVKNDPELRDVPVVLITNADDAADRERSVRAGADDVLTKPIHRISLIQSGHRFIRYSEVRGLKRVPMVAPVKLGPDGTGIEGVSRDVSRGGMMVEFDAHFDSSSEVELHFALPEPASAPLRPTAKVIWRRHEGSRSSIGLQFLSLDGTGARQIDEFVYERSAIAESTR